VRGDWFTGITVGTARVECGGESHVLRWREGRFSALAHPGADLEAERALAALGGEPCPCLELRDAWERHAADPRVLVLGPRHQDSRLALEHQQLARGRRGPSRPGSAPRPGPTSDAAIRSVLDLDSPLPHLFVATVAAALAAQTGDAGLGPRLHAALYGRLLASIHRWTDQTPELELVMGAGGDGDGDGVAGDGENRSLVRQSQETLAARLPFDWITEVWARRLDVVDGEFTLAARPSASGAHELLTVDHAMVRHTRTIGAP
jgi:hypothetical protein